MCSDLIHRLLPGDVVLRGVIARSKNNQVLYYAAGDQSITTTARNLKISGAKVLRTFRGYRDELIPLIQELRGTAVPQGYELVLDLTALATA